MKHITDREKAILFALQAGYIKTWQEAFILSYNGPEETARNLKKVSSSVTHWKRHPEVVQATEEIKQYLAARDKLLIDNEIQKLNQEQSKEGNEGANGGSVRIQERPETGIDYYDPRNQKRQINYIIQQANGDPKTQLDAIKAIQQTQRDDKQAAREGKTVKVYLPLTCDTCPVLARAKEKREK